ncbi:MAG: tetratricopeptide repeat protein [Akkermansia sp.]
MMFAHSFRWLAQAPLLAVTLLSPLVGAQPAATPAAAVQSPEELYEQAEFCFNDAKGKLAQLQLALRLYQQAADAGHAEAQYTMALLLTSGLMTEIDLPAARHYLSLAAAQLTEAKLLLATLYLRGGWGFEPNALLACQLLDELASAGDADAQFLLGNCCLKGSGVSQDSTRGLALLEQAAAQDQLPALLLLAYCYREGQHVKANELKALQMTAKAAQLGSPEATYWLGMSYRYPEQFLESNRQLAFERFKQASMDGEQAAVYELGLCYLLAYGVEANAELALIYLMDAAAAGHPKARLMVALCWASGLGCEASWSEAMYWLAY